MKHLKRNVTIAAVLLLVCAAVYLNTAVFKFLMYFGDSGPSVLRDQAQNADHCDHIFKHCGGSGVFVHLVTSGVR